MKNIEQLFIRACKSYNPPKRLKSIRKRFYMLTYDISESGFNIAMLSDIVDKYCPITINEFLRKRSEHYSYNELSKKKQPEQEIIDQVLISKIRFAKSEDLINQGFIVPLKFRGN